MAREITEKPVRIELNGETLHGRVKKRWCDLPLAGVSIRKDKTTGKPFLSLRPGQSVVQLVLFPPDEQNTL